MTSNRGRVSMRAATLLTGLITASAIAAGTSAVAHDLHGLVVERSSLDENTRAKIDKSNELRRLLAARANTAPGTEGLEAVIQATLRWPGGKISVCFFDGGMPARDHVATVATKWSEGTSIAFDFGPAGARRTCDPANPSNVRISFRGDGYWSYVGTQARLIDPNKQTLNLQGMDRAQFNDNDNGVILHEFGHAVGFEHEHQSPKSGCQEQFNWSYLYTAMGWSKEEVDRNMRRLDSSSSAGGLLVTTFDRQSIMLYSLEPAAFKDPAHASCFIPEPNNAISSVDRQAIAKIYPLLPPGAPAPAAGPPPTVADPAAAQALNQLRGLLQYTP